MRALSSARRGAIDFRKNQTLRNRESLERLTRDALVAYYRAHYVPDGMVVAVSGQVKTAEVQAQVARLFGGMPAGKAPTPSPPAPPPMAASRQVFTVPGAQAQIVMSGLAPALTGKDHAPTKVLASLLGGGMAGRYFSELFESGSRVDVVRDDDARPPPRGSAAPSPAPKTAGVSPKSPITNRSPNA